MAGSLQGGSVSIEFEDKNEFPSITSAMKSAEWGIESPITSWAPILGYKSWPL